MKYCPFCGSGLQDAMVFCPKCGKRFLDAFENPETLGQLDIESNLPECPEVSTQGSASTQVVDDASKADSIPPKEPARKSIKRKTGLVLLSAIFVVAVIALIFFGKSDNESELSITDAANSVLYLEVFDDKDNVIATASGFVIDDGTVLVTNYHVVEDAYHIVAWTADGEKSVDVSRMLAYDETADLAVLKCDSDVGVSPLTLADSDHVEQGDTIYAVGYPLGLANTLSDGVVSSRYVNNDGKDMLQITAAISHGSSGGALFDEKGHVIGIICASYVEGQNLNLAIPTNTLASLLSSPMHSIKLAKRYERKPHPYQLNYVLENRQSFEGKDVLIEAYVSSVVVVSIDGNTQVDYVFVGTEADVLGYIGNGNSIDFYEDDNYLKYYAQFELDRVQNYTAVTIFENDPAVIHQPGEKVRFYGIIKDVVNESTGEHFMRLRMPRIVEDN